MKSLHQLVERLSALDSDRCGGLSFDFQPMPGEVEVVQVTVQDREELPIYLTLADHQLLCICYLWQEQEVDPAQRTALYAAMLDMNIPMPLSSFARIDDRFAIFGALSRDSSVDDVALELAALSDNAVDALEAFAGYLN
jgi:hypothetical protein